MTSKWGVVKKEGISFFKEDKLTAVRKFIDELARLGVFVVPCGELEQWIDTGMKKGKEWNREALTMLQTEGCPPELEAFVQRVVAFLFDSGSIGSSTY